MKTDSILNEIREAVTAEAPKRWAETLLDYGAEQLPPPPVIAWVGDVPAIFKGSLHLICGPKKAGKTTLIRIIAAAIISGEPALGITAERGLNVHIYDTEQPPWRIHQQISKAFEMAGKPRKTIDALRVFQLKEFDCEKRLQAIIESVEDYAPDLVIVDGVADLVHDINDMAESGRVVDALNNIAKESSVLCVLHTNPSSPEGKSRGNLGTIIENKAEATFLVVRQGDIFTVRCKDSRGRGFDPFSYTKTINDDIIQASTPINERPLTAKERIYSAMEPGRDYTTAELIGIVSNVSEGTAKSAIHHLCREGRIVSVRRGSYALNFKES